MTVIQRLLELHGHPVKPTAQQRVQSSLDGFWERQKLRKAHRRDVAKVRKPREKRPIVIPGQTNRAERRMILNALSIHEEIIARERRDYIMPPPEPKIFAEPLEKRRASEA